MKQKVSEVLEKIRPVLQRDGGDVELVEVSDDGIVLVRLKGACSGCPGAPGISLISPGEIITTEIITYIQEGVKNGMIVSGIKDANLEYIDIIDIG